MKILWETIILNPSFNALNVLYQVSGNLGIAILLFTLLAKFALLPVTIPQLKMTKKQRLLQPELEKLKKKYKYDKQKLAEKQMELFKKHGVNPGAGCLTTIITIVLMLAIYRSVSMFTTATDISVINARIYFESLKLGAQEVINTKFLYLDLSKPDPYLIVTLATVALQFLFAKMNLPYTEAGEKAANKTPEKSDDIMQSMQKQNMYMMPLMFLIFGITLPSGVMVYIMTSTLFQIVQGVYFNGWGGLKPWINKLKSARKNKQ